MLTIKPILLCLLQEAFPDNPSLLLLIGPESVIDATGRLSNRNHRTSLANVKTHLLLAFLDGCTDLGWPYASGGLRGCWLTQAGLGWDDRSSLALLRVSPPLEGQPRLVLKATAEIQRQPARSGSKSQGGPHAFCQGWAAPRPQRAGIAQLHAEGPLWRAGEENTQDLFSAEILRVSFKAPKTPKCRNLSKTLNSCITL